MSDRGAALLMTPLIVALTGVGLLAVSVMATALDAATRAQSAADAAALAAAPRTLVGNGSAHAAAAAMAAANEVRIVECRCQGDASFRPRTVTVEVATEARLPILGTRRVTADATAEFRPAVLLRAAAGATEPVGTIAGWRGSGRTTGDSSPRRSSRTSGTASPASPIRGSPR